MFSSVVPANLSSSARTWYFNWRWLGSNNTTIRNTQAANTLRGRLVIKNDYFTSQNVALPIYLDSENVDSIYKGEASYNDIKKTPIGVYVYIPTNIAIMNAGTLQFWFENKDGGGSKLTQEGEELLDKYEKFIQEMNEYAKIRFKEIFEDE
mgnify:CR=1 FL=1